MIDTDKYEGHTDGSGWIWEAFWDKELVKFGKTDRQLIADAPKLLAEVKRLKAKLFEAELWVNNDSYTFENDIKELIDYLKVIE